MTQQMPVGARDLAARRRRLRDHIGRQILELRTEAGISQGTFARAIGVDQAHLSRIERGLARPSLDLLVAIGACLGADLGVRFFPGSGPRLKDRIQAPMIEALIRILHPRWTRLPEVAVPKARGYVDLALGLRDADAGIECEAHSEMRVVDELLRRHIEKTLGLAELGLVGADVSRLLLVRSMKRNRDVARLFEATLMAAYPARAADALAALRGAEAPWPGPTMLWAKVEGGRAEILDRPPRGVRVGR